MRRSIFIVAAALLGCGGESTGPGATIALGTYTLTTVNGQPLPFTEIESGVPGTPGYRKDQRTSEALTITGQSGSTVSATHTTVDQITSGSTGTVANQTSQQNVTMTIDGATISTSFYGNGTFDTQSIRLNAIVGADTTKYVFAKS